MKTRKNFRLNDVLLKKAEDRSKNEKITLTKLIEKALKKYLKEETSIISSQPKENKDPKKVQKVKTIKPTQRDIDKGRFVLKLSDYDPSSESEPLPIKREEY